MKFILKLLKEILNRVSNLYSNESVDEFLSSKVSKEDSDGAIESLAKSRKDKDDIVQGLIDSNKSYDEALTNVIKWQSYAASMQSMVEEDTAIQIAEEFEKAAEEYLKDPTVTVNWSLSHELDESGNYVTNNPYFFESTDRPIVDFTVVGCSGSNLQSSPSFNKSVDVPVFLPNVTSCAAIIRHPSTFNSPLFLPSAKSCSYLAYINTYFNSFIHAPMASDCTYLLFGAKSFNQKLRLPNATGCSYMLNDATSFNQPLSLPKATTGTNLLKNATSFNSSIDFPIMVSCNGLLYKAKSFNQSFTLPNAKDCHTLCQEASSLDQPVYLPACRGATNAFLKSGMSAGNISKTLDSLPTWTDGDSHVISFVDCPGQASTQYLEPFTVTDTDGTEYTLENCPRFDTDDENQTLRKSFVLAIVKKGWTVDLSESALAWYEYTLEKATLTGEQKNIDLVNEILADYKADNTNVVATQLIDNWRTLTEYEAFSEENEGGDPFTQEFWIEYFRATEEYKADQMATSWTYGNGSSPYEGVNIDNALVDFNVKSIRGLNDNTSRPIGIASTGIFFFPNVEDLSMAFRGFRGLKLPAYAPKAKILTQTYRFTSFSAPIYAHEATIIQYLVEGNTNFNEKVFAKKAENCVSVFSGCINFNQPLDLPKATACQYMLRGATAFNHPLDLPNATNCSYMLQNATAFNHPLDLPNATNCSYMLQNATAFNQLLNLPKCSEARSAFTNTAMSAENISKTLDSLPMWADGAEHVITFTGCPGVAELTQDSPSVAAAVYKGWTVEL